MLAPGYVMAVLLVHVRLGLLLDNLNSQHSLLVALSSCSSLAIWKNLFHAWAVPGHKAIVLVSVKTEQCFTAPQTTLFLEFQHPSLLATLNGLGSEYIVSNYKLFIATTTRKWNYLWGIARLWPNCTIV